MTMSRLLLSFLVLLSAGWATATERIVSVDAALTEINYALGAGERLLGVDSSSQFLPEVEGLPDVGYKRRLSAEGILALGPELILATADAGPPEVLEQIQATGVEVVVVPDQPTVAGLHGKARAVATALGLQPQGEDLIARIDADLAEARQLVDNLTAGADASPPRVLFLLVIGSGADMSGGRDTVADVMIHMAGGVNVMHDAFEDYKPIAAEAVVAAAPEVILVTQRNFDGLGGPDGILGRVGVDVTPAGQAGRIVTMDGLLLLGFGPRTGQAVAELARQLHAGPPVSANPPVSK